MSVALQCRQVVPTNDLRHTTIILLYTRAYIAIAFVGWLQHVNVDAQRLREEKVPTSSQGEWPISSISHFALRCSMNKLNIVMWTAGG